MAAVIVSFNTRDHLSACLGSLAHTKLVETVVVDNGSTDGSIELVRDQYKWVRLEVASANDGYGAAANRGIACCTAPYVLLLNSDTELQPDAAHALTAYMTSHPRAGVVGPRILNADGSLQASCFPFPTPWSALLSETELGYLIRYVPGVRRRYLRTWSHDRPRVVPWVRGAALAIRRDAFAQLGGFDARFHMYFEEVDFCYRAHTLGWEVHFAPVTDVLHHGGVSTRHYRAAMLARYYESMLLFYRLHYSARRLARLQALLRAIALTRLGRDRLRMSLSRADATRRRLSENVALWRELVHRRWPGVTDVSRG